MSEPNYPALVKSLLQTRTQQGLARELGVQQVTIWRWLTGKSKPKGAAQKALLELAKKRGVL